MKKRKKSRKMIKAVKKEIKKLPATPEYFTHERIYQALQELHFQGEYNLVIKICNALRNK